MRVVVVSPQSKKALVALYGAAAVSRAFNFKNNSSLSKEIRNKAMNEHSGQILTF